MSTNFQQETAFTPAPASPLPPPSGPLLWVPLDEVRQTWASFGVEALSCSALLATSNAFRALCWETSALRYRDLACQAQQRGGLLRDAAAPWLDRVIQDLGEAIRDWRNVQLWLERLATRDTRPTCTGPLEQVHVLSQQVATQQERLHHLLGQVRQERSVYCCGGQAAASTPTASDAAVTRQAAAGGGASHGA
jgi:hypothetical protein